MLNFSNDVNYSSLLYRFEDVCGVDIARNLAFSTGFILRLRGLQPDLLLLAAFDLLDNDASLSLKGLYSRYGQLCCDADFKPISAVAFFKQLSKPQFCEFAKQIFERASSFALKERVSNTAKCP